MMNVRPSARHDAAFDVIFKRTKEALPSATEGGLFDLISLTSPLFHPILYRPVAVHSSLNNFVVIQRSMVYIFLL